MAWSPPDGDNIEFALSGAYSPPAGDAIHFYLPAVVISQDYHPDIWQARCSVVTCAVCDLFATDVVDVGVDIDTGGISQLQYLTVDTIAIAAVVPETLCSDLYSVDTQCCDIDLACDWDQVRVFRTSVAIPTTVAVSASALPPWILPTQQRSAIRLPHAIGDYVDNVITGGWNGYAVIDDVVVLPYSQADRYDCACDMPYNDLNCYDDVAILCYDSLLPLDIAAGCCYIDHIPAIDYAISICNDDLSAQDISIDHPYRYPSYRDIDKSLCHNFMRPYYKEYDIIDNICRFVDPKFTYCFGKLYYQRICVRDYQPMPADAIAFVLDFPGHVGDQDHIDFWFDKFTYDLRCSQREPSGWRDSDIVRPFLITARRVAIKEVYVIANSILISRLPDRLPLEFVDLSIGTDADSWCWSFTASTSHAPTIAAVTTQSDDLIEIEVDINGWKWVFAVESIERRAQFGQETYSLAGRSPSLYFAGPYAPERTYTSASITNVAAAITDELARGATGWQLDWQLGNSLQLNWNLPPAIYSYADKTPMEVIASIIGAVRGRIVSDRTQQIIHVMPRYKYPPWELASHPEDIWIADSVVLQHTYRHERGILYNGLHVIAPKSGIMMHVKRSGSNGQPAAPQVVDDLLSCQDAIIMAGKMTLAQAGSWRKHEIIVPIMPVPDEPGLIDVGEIVAINTMQNQTFKGYCMANNISVRNNIDVQQAIVIMEPL